MEGKICECPLDLMIPASSTGGVLSRICERCGQVISFDKYEAYKRSHGLSGYDEDNRDIEQTQNKGDYYDE